MDISTASSQTETTHAKPSSPLLDPNEIYINTSQVRGGIHYKLIKIPPQLVNDPLCKISILFLNNIPNKTSRKTITNITFAIALLFQFAADNFSSLGICPTSIFEELRKYLTTNNVTGQSIRAYNTIYRKILNWYLDNHSAETTHISAKDLNRLYELRIRIESIPKSGSSKPRTALSQLLPEFLHDDKILVNAVTHYSCGLLRILQQHRDTLLAAPGVKNKLAEITRNYDNSEYNVKSYTAQDIDSFISIYEATCASQDETLKERLLISSKHIRDFITTLSFKPDTHWLDVKLKDCTWGNGNLRRSAKCKNELEYDKSSSTALSFLDLNFDFLLSPSSTEEICLGWLMGSERIQNSGQIKMLISDIHITPTACMANYEKGRSNAMIRESTLHNSRSLQYKAYTNFVRLRSNYNQTFLKNASNYLLNKLSAAACLISSTSHTYRLIYLSTLDNSWLNEKLMSIAPKSAPFIELLAGIIKHNDKHIQEMNSYNLMCSEQKSTPPPKRTDYVRTSIISISPNTIAQSRALLEEENHAKSIHERQSQRVVDADATAHTAQTKDTTYKSRSNTDYRNKIRTNFSTAVGALMESDARKVSALLARTDMVTLQQIENELGWSNHINKNDISTFNDMLESAERLGYQCTPFGGLSRLGKRIVIISPITVALMLSYKNGCEQAIESANSNERILALTVQAGYIGELLHRFDRRTYEEGLDIHKTYDFPLPPL